jgi:hypothetical protein
LNRRQEVKVFWLFFFRKEHDSSFSEEKEAKRLLFYQHGVRKSGTWPESDAKLVVSSERRGVGIYQFFCLRHRQQISASAR